MEEEYNVEEELAKVQHKLLNHGFSLEHHLETVKKLPRENKLKYYEELFQERKINEKQYEGLIKEDLLHLNNS